MPGKLGHILAVAVVFVAAAGCAGPSGDIDGESTQGSEMYGPGAVGNGKLEVQVGNKRNVDMEFHVELYTPGGKLVWSASGVVGKRPPDKLVGGVEFMVDPHPTQESYDYQVKFESGGMRLDETYGVSEFHDDAIQLYVTDEKVYITQAYY